MGAGLLCQAGALAEDAALSPMAAAGVGQQGRGLCEADGMVSPRVVWCAAMSALTSWSIARTSPARPM